MPKGRALWVSIAACQLGIIAGCDGRRPGVSQSLLYDSAGVRIASHDESAPAQMPVRTLPAEPSIEIGAGDGDSGSQFFRIRSIVGLRNGGFIVADGASAELRVYDAAGHRVGAIGRPGDGPGEFRRLGWAGAGRDDSIFVYDLQQQRISVFGGVAFQRSIRIALPSVRFPSARVLLGDGSVLVEPEQIYSPASARGVHRDTLVLYRLNASGHFEGVFARVPGEDRFVLPAKTSVRSVPLAFGRNVVTAVGDSALYIAGTDRYEICGFTLTGVPRLILRMRRPPRSVTPALIAAHRQRELSRIEGQEWQRFFAQMYDSMEYPALLPQLSALRVDDQQRLWVRDYPMHPDSEAQWTVFDPDGRLEWTIRMPAAFQLHAIAHDRVFGVWRDTDDVEHVRVYALRAQR